MLLTFHHPSTSPAEGCVFTFHSLISTPGLSHYRTSSDITKRWNLTWRLFSSPHGKSAVLCGNRKSYKSPGCICGLLYSNVYKNIWYQSQDFVPASGTFCRFSENWFACKGMRVNHSSAVAQTCSSFFPITVRVQDRPCFFPTVYTLFLLFFFIIHFISFLGNEVPVFTRTALVSFSWHQSVYTDVMSPVAKAARYWGSVLCLCSKYSPYGLSENEVINSLLSLPTLIMPILLHHYIKVKC